MPGAQCNIAFLREVVHIDFVHTIGKRQYTVRQYLEGIARHIAEGLGRNIEES